MHWNWMNEILNNRHYVTLVGANPSSSEIWKMRIFVSRGIEEISCSLKRCLSKEQRYNPREVKYTGCVASYLIISPDCFALG